MMELIGINLPWMPCNLQAIIEISILWSIIIGCIQSTAIIVMNLHTTNTFSKSCLLPNQHYAVWSRL